MIGLVYPRVIISNSNKVMFSIRMREKGKHLKAVSSLTRSEAWIIRAFTLRGQIYFLYSMADLKCSFTI